MLQLQKQKELRPILDSSFYTQSKAHSIEVDISNTIITYSQLTPAKVASKCEKFITCFNTNLRPNRVTFERRMVNNYKPFVKNQKLGIHNKYCYDSSYNLIHTNNTNRLFSAYGNKRLRDICNCDTINKEKINIVVKFISGLGVSVIDTVFKLRSSNGNLVLLEDAKVGTTYSLYSETDHAAYLIWNSSPGDVGMTLGPYDEVKNNNHTNVPQALFNSGEFSRLDVPRPIDYPVKFDLDYGVTLLYLYATLNGKIFSPSTLFGFFSITTKRI